MSRVACPFCFTRIDSSHLAYQCTNRGVTQCTAEEDPERTRLTGNTLPSFPTFMPARNMPPTCPGCGAEALRRACPQCHTALPLAFIDTNSPTIGIVGSKGSGKSVLMMVLIRQLREQVGKRFQAAVRIATDQPDGSEGVEAYRVNREEPFFDGHALPPATQEDSTTNRRQSVVMLWQGEPARRLGVRRSGSTVLSFVDTAGEDLNSYDKTFSQRYLPVCNGLIVALDPFALPGARARLNLRPLRPVHRRNPAGGHLAHHRTPTYRAAPQATQENQGPHRRRIHENRRLLLWDGPRKPGHGQSTSGAGYTQADGQAVHETVRA